MIRNEKKTKKKMSSVIGKGKKQMVKSAKEEERDKNQPFSEA